MKAITLHQPYASLIADGAKTIETRSWPPPISILGQRIAIHAAAKKDRIVREAIKSFHPGGLLARESDWSAITIWPPSNDREVRANFYAGGARADTVSGSCRIAYPLGAVVATAALAGAGQVAAEPSAASVRLKHGRTVRTDEFGDFSLGRWLWFLEDVEPIEPPQTAKGRQGFWDWDAP